MNLTPDQQQQIDSLGEQTREKLSKLLTPDQMKIIQNRPPRPAPPPQQ